MYLLCAYDNNNDIAVYCFNGKFIEELDLSSAKFCRPLQSAGRHFLMPTSFSRAAVLLGYFILNLPIVITF